MCIRDRTATAAVLTALAPQVFVTSAHPKVYSQAERGHLATVRLQSSGTRFVMATPEAALMAFMRSRSPGAHPTFAQVWTFFKMMNNEQLKAYADGQGKNMLWTSTVTAGDLSYIPPSFVVADRVMHESVVGIKKSILMECHRTDLEKVYLELEARKREQNPSAQLVKEAVACAARMFAMPSRRRWMLALPSRRRWRRMVAFPSWGRRWTQAVRRSQAGRGQVSDAGIEEHRATGIRAPQVCLEWRQLRAQHQRDE